MIQSKTQIFLTSPETRDRINEGGGNLFQNSKSNKNSDGKFTNSKHGNWAGDLFRPLVIFLRILGQSPLSYVTTNQNRGRQEKAKAKNFVITSDSTISSHPVYALQTTEDEQQESHDDEIRREYKIVYSSILTYWSVAIGIGCILNWASTTFEMAFDLDLFGGNTAMAFFDIRGMFQKFATKGLKNSTLGDKEAKMAIDSIRQWGKVAVTLVPLSQLLELICSWLETGLFSRFLNNWTGFEEEFHRAFPFYQNLERNSLTLQRNLLFLYYVGLPSIVIIIGSLFLTEFENFKSLILAALVMIPFTLHSISAMLLEDIKVILTYRVTADAFLQIKNGMSYNVTWEKLTAEKVKAWRGLVHKVRQQAVLAGRYQKTHQLILITLSMVLITGLVFILLNGPWEMEGSWIFFTLSLGYTLVLIGRIYLKILAADRITHNESLISKELTGINSSELAVQLELKFLHDMIRQNPTTISFGNYVTLNKRLILGIASQVVTYLIVLMQFSQSKDNS